MSNTRGAHTLNELGFCAGLPAPILAELNLLATGRVLPAGTVVFREGAFCGDLFVIAEGLVALDQHVPGRGPVRILTIGPGELLGWSALFGNGQMTATATAVTETTAFAVSGNRLRDLCDRNPEAGYRIMQQVASALARRLTATRLQLLDLYADPGGHSPDLH